MGQINILIIDSDEVFSSKLKFGLEQLNYNIVDIIDEDQNALPAFYATEPEIVIVSVNLKGSISGIEIAQRIYNDSLNSKPVIFISDDESENNFNEAKLSYPSAYLIKPFSLSSMKYAIDLALQNFGTSMVDTSIKRRESAEVLNTKHLFVRKSKKIIKVPISEILYIEVESKYSTLITHQGKFILRISLKDLIDKLPKEMFVRIHRNYIINIDRITEFDLEEYTVHLPDKSLPLGRKYKNYLVEQLQFLS